MSQNSRFEHDVVVLSGARRGLGYWRLAKNRRAVTAAAERSAASRSYASLEMADLETSSSLDGDAPRPKRQQLARTTSFADSFSTTVSRAAASPRAPSRCSTTDSAGRLLEVLDGTEAVSNGFSASPEALLYLPVSWC